MKKNKGITLIKLLLIILVIFIIGCILYYNFANKISQDVDMFFKSITGQINVNDEIENNEILLGITDVKGQGVVINILDGKDLIHQEDLIIILDELKNAGSQAISINGQRITNSTYLYCDGSVILIDGEKIGNPFTIKAIGNSDTIYGALMRNKGYLSILQRDGLEINVEKSENVEIAKTNNEALLNYAKGKNAINTVTYGNQLIGKSAMNGRGIEIVIHQTKAKLSALSFLQIINDLRSGGAVAISINGNRITNMTDIMDISSTYVLVNSIPISAPFLVQAIGDQDKLEEVLNYNNSYVSKIREKGNEVEIYRTLNLKIDPYVQKKDKDKMSIDYLK